MVAFLAVLVALVVVVGVWYEAGSRRRRLDAETLVARRDRELAQILEASNEGFLSFDAGGSIMSWSANSEQLFGWGPTEVLGRGMTETLMPVLYRQAYENGLASFRAGADSAIVGRRVETTALHHDGHEFPVEMMIWHREDGGFNAFVRDITLRGTARSGNDPLDLGSATISLSDPLTSLGNRRSLEKDLAVYEGQVTRYGHRSCIALFDIDDFARFNDLYGQPTGDEVIVTIADRLASGCRSGDSVYRVGGDEFICLLAEQSLETGALAVDRMCRSIEELAIPHEGSPTGFLTVSAGLALLDAEHLKATAELLKDAEAARHQGKYPDSLPVEHDTDETPST